MSRNEKIVKSIVDKTEYTVKPQSRIEALLLELKEVIEGGADEEETDESK